MRNKSIVLFLMAMAMVAQDAPPDVDFLSPELKAFLKLDAKQVKTINGVIADHYAYFDAQFPDYVDLQDKIDSLRNDPKMEPQAIALALVEPTAAAIVIERKLGAKLKDTEKAISGTLTPPQQVLRAQLVAAQALEPLISDAVNAFVVSDQPQRSPLSFGVGTIVDGHQLSKRDLRVLLRGGKAGVSQQFLNRPQIRTITQ